MNIELPLPFDTQEFHTKHWSRCHNLGLLMDRYIPWRPGWKFEEKDKYNWLEKDIKPKVQYLDELVKANCSRWQQVVETAGAKENETWFTSITDWRMVVGLGGGHVVETALTLHRIYGFPIIPGSALKGMTRAWVELEVEPDDDLAVAVFGTSPGVTPMKVGQVIFFDAVPTQTPTLQVDVMNPHYGKYYSESTDSRGRPIPPTDCLSPKPVYFLTVAEGCEFAFAVAPRDGNEALAETAAGWLREALDEMGVGAKTTSGYGYWDHTRSSRSPQDHPQRPEDLKPGQVLSGTILNITHFGAFVDIGVRHDGLVYISELSEEYVESVDAVVQIGQQVQVRVLSVEQRKDKWRISLTMKGV
jgi:CRISPR-associated protein Cmr6